MNILMLAPQPFFVERGTPIAVRMAAETLARQGHHVDLLVFHEGADIDMPGVRIHRIASPRLVRGVGVGFSVAKLVCDAFLLVAAIRLLRRQRYAVVHAVEEAVFIAMLLRRVWAFRLVYDMDSALVDQIADKWPRLAPALGPFRRLEASAVRAADLVLAVCPELTRFAAGIGGDRAKVHTLPDVASEAAILPGVEDLRGLAPPGAMLALYVGNLERYQGIDLLLDAMAALPAAERPFTIVIGGTDAAVARYRRIAADAGLARATLFLGARPLDRLGTYLLQADMLCSPRAAGVNTPMKIYAYMISAQPIIATRILSHTQVLDDDTAMLVDPTPQDFARGLRTLTASAATRHRLGNAAARVARTSFDRASFDRRLADAYRTLPTAAA